MRTNVHAHTETGASRPGYISINQEESGACFVAVRNRGGKTTASIEMNPDQLEAMARDILKHLGVNITPAPAPVKAKGK